MQVRPGDDDQPFCPWGACSQLDEAWANGDRASRAEAPDGSKVFKCRNDAGNGADIQVRDFGKGADANAVGVSLTIFRILKARSMDCTVICSSFVL